MVLTNHDRLINTISIFIVYPLGRGATSMGLLLGVHQISWLRRLVVC